MSAASKPSKNKPVRDSFTMPKQEYAQIAEMKQRAAKLGRPTKKSEVLRAALALLGALSDQHLLSALLAVPSIKTGRPKAESAPVKPVAKPVAQKAAVKPAVTRKVAVKKAAKPVTQKGESPKPAAKKVRATKARQA